MGSWDGSGISWTICKQVYTWSMVYVRTGKKGVETMMTEQD